MNTLTRDQKIAALVLPVLLLGVLGTSYASAHNIDLTDEQREAIERAHELREAGDFEGARAVLEDADVKRGHKRHSETRMAIREAVAANDYDAFLAATEHAPFAGEITEDMFDALTSAYELREEGDFEGARAVLEDAGFPKHKGMHAHRKGMHKNIQNP